MQSKLFSITFVLAFTMAFAVLSRADVPAPPANQQTGIPDGLFNDLEEAECRLCHENPDQFPVEPESIPDRHHLLMNSPVTVGTCSVSGSQCQTNAGIHCPESFEICIGASAAPFPPAPGGIFTCFSCHDVDCSTGICNINVYRDCTFCHYQFIGEPGADTTVHHLSPTAQSGDCVFCHGDIVDNMDDGHIIPTHEPSSVTPSPSGGDGLPLNSRGKGAGACDYCHDDGTDAVTGIFVETNARTHHFTGLGNDVIKCEWCHDMSGPGARIRRCEGCHGYESLHNIQVDSDGDGVINPGIEMPFYGHIGNPDDCWGCHGFSQSSAPGTGPITPHISSSNISVLTAGYDTSVTLSGSAFTNFDNGVELLSNVVLTAGNGSTIELIPDSIGQESMTVSIPGTLTSGNYYLRAVKDVSGSNPAVVSVKPEVTITDVQCNRKRGVLTIYGSGFSEKVEGTDAYINTKVNGVTVDIISWTDSRIRASVSRCSNGYTVIVNSLFGSAASGDGKPPKPCKGKGCNK